MAFRHVFILSLSLCGLGPNGLRALRGLGILDSLLASLDDQPDQRGCVFVSGLPGHELIYDVGNC